MALGLSEVVKKVAALHRKQRQLAAEQRRDAVQDSATRTERVSETEKDLARISLAGLLTQDVLDAVYISAYSTRWNIRIERADLPKWRAVGKLSARCREFSDTDADGKNFIDVTVSVEGLLRAQIVYRRELPESEKCKVQEVTNTYTNKALVCTRS